MIYLRVWVFAATVRLLLLAITRPKFTLYYWDAASGLLQNGSLSLDGVRTAMLEPLYPLFLAATRTLVGDRPLVVQALQALVASAGAVYLYKLAVALTGRRQVATAAAVLFAVYPLLVRHSIDGTESALLTTLLIAFASRFVTARTASDAAVAGAWLGFAVLTRAVAAPLLVIAPLAAAAKGRRAVMAMAGTALVVLAPYAIRNYALSGVVVPARNGINLFIANCEYAAGVIADYGPDILMPYAESRLAGEGLGDLPNTPQGEQQGDAAHRRRALAHIRQHPVETLQLKIRNIFDFFSPVLVPHRATTAETTIHLGVNGTSTVENSVARPLGHHIAYSVSYGLVFTLAAVGVYHRRRELAADAILWSVVLTFAAVHAVFFPSTRYRAPVDFVLLFYAGTGLVVLVDERRRSSSALPRRSNATAA